VREIDLFTNKTGRPNYVDAVARYSRREEGIELQAAELVFEVDTVNLILQSDIMEELIDSA
jgi:hypothetical protein